MEKYAEDEFDPVFRTVVGYWIKAIKHARDDKRERFGRQADECLNFYNGPRSWEQLFGREGAGADCDEVPETTFQVSVNKTFEFVSIFGPAMYFENPVRTVKPRMPVVIPPDFFPDPMVYQSMMVQEDLRLKADGLRSVLIEAYLNWTPVEFHMETESRRAIDEALIKGRGCLWTELYTPPGTTKNVVRSFFDSVDNLLVDPDAPSFDKAQWIARRCIHPVWQVERDYGLRKGSLRGNLESQARQADVEASEDAEWDRRQGKSNDLIVYWKIFSKMGIGGRMVGAKPGIRGPLEMFGDYCYVVVAENVPFFLNLPPDVTNDPSFSGDPTAIFNRVAWPTPFWGADEWPVSELDFHSIPNSPWPLAHLMAGMGELKFLQWTMSFLMGHIRTSSRDFIACLKSAAEEIKTSILTGGDLTLLEIEESQGDISKVIQFLQHPQVNGDIWKMIQEVEGNFDKRVGLTELMYGMQGATQIRSAQEADLRNQNMNVRPDDMRKQVSTWMARVAAKEALCARFHLIGDDVQPILGSMGAWAWSQYVSTRDPGEACHQLEYRIEAGSMSRPNKEWEVKTMDTAFQNLSPVFQTYMASTGDPRPLNNLVADYAKAHDLDSAHYQLAAPQMMQALPDPGDPTQGGIPSPGHQSPATTNVAPPG